MESDEELVSAYVRGEKSALTKLVERHLKAVYAFALRFTGEKSDAEDVVQESFLKAWKNLKIYAPQKGRFKTWLMYIVRNTAIDHLRKRKSIPFSAFEHEDEGEFETMIADDSPLPDEIVARRNDVAALENALQTLSLPHREILLLYNGNDLTFEEMASVLNISVNTIKSRHRRALLALREALMHPNRQEPRI